MKTYAKVDNKVVEVKVVKKNYNDHASEVVIMEGCHEGMYVIVEKKDFIKAADCRYMVQVSIFSDTDRTWKYRNLKATYTLEEARKLKQANSYRESRILDRLTKEYVK